MKRKRCSYLNLLLNKEKAIISDGFTDFAPPIIPISNTFITELRELYELRHFLNVKLIDTKEYKSRITGKVKDYHALLN